LPLLPKFSKLRSDKDNRGLQKKLVSGIEYCFLTTIFLSGFFITFNNQIVQLVFQRGSFDYSAALKVKNILIAYAVGIPFYLYRDLLVRSYYSIEKTNFPFKLSFAGIILNIFFQSTRITRNFKQTIKKFTVQDESKTPRVQIIGNLFRYSVINSFYEASIVRKFMFYPR